MKGYKIAFHEGRRDNIDVFNGLHYEKTVIRIPVLVVLDIPDDAQMSTPENRYTEENMEIYRQRAKEKNFPFVPPDFHVLNEYKAYCAYRYDDPLTIYNHTIDDMRDNLEEAKTDARRRNLLCYLDKNIFSFVHVSKCRCDKAKVVDIIGIFNGMHYEHAVSLFAPDFIYRLYGGVNCEDFGTFRHMIICAPGIHFFEYPVLAILYMLNEMPELIRPVCGGKIDARVTERYLTEELNTLKREDKAIEYCKADVAGIEKLLEESCHNSAYGLSIPSGKDEDNEE